eukprot:CFRG6833T1
MSDQNETVSATTVEETAEFVNDTEGDAEPAPTASATEEVAEASETTTTETTAEPEAEDKIDEPTTAAESESEASTLKRTRDDDAAPPGEDTVGKKALKTNTEVAITTSTPVDSTKTIYPGVTAVLNSIYATGKLKPGDVEQGAIDSLLDFPESVAVEIMEKYSMADYEVVRNKTGFLIGIIKRYRNSNQKQPYMQQGYGGGGGGYATSQPTPAPTPTRTELAASTKAMLDQLYASGIVSEAELGEKCLTQLKCYSEEVANQILQKFKEADMKDIRSKAGFLHGIMRRFATESGTQAHPTTSPLQTQTAFQLLPWSVQMRISPLYQTGVLLQNDIEARVYESLAQFPEHIALDITTKFCESDLPRVNNKSGWLIGIMKRFRAAAANGPPGGGGYGHPPPQQYQHQQYNNNPYQMQQQQNYQNYQGAQDQYAQQGYGQSGQPTNYGGYY